MGAATGFIPLDIFPILAAVSFATIFLTPLSMALLGGWADGITQRTPHFLARWHQSYVKTLHIASLMRMPGFRMKRTHKSLRWFFDMMKQNYRDLTFGNTSSTLDRLAPWDEYLSEVFVGAGSFVEGKSLLELNVRSRHGVNVVAVARNLTTHISPDPALRLLPGDELLVYGTEETITSFARTCETTSITPSGSPLHECELMSLKLSPNHPFVGKTLRELNFREAYSCIILALMRNLVRIKTPDADFQLEGGDEVFIVGPRPSLQALPR